MTAMSSRRIDDALHGRACSIHPLGGGAGVLIGCGNWWHREGFTSWLWHHPDGQHQLGNRDHRLDADELPRSGAERHGLRLAVSHRRGTIPVSLCDTLSGIDHRNADLVIKAIGHVTALHRHSRICY